MKRSFGMTGCVLAAAVSLSGCKVGPNYTPPATTMPANYGELDPAAAADTLAAEEVRWWQTLNDPQLTALVEQAVAANNNIAVAEARLREARAVRKIAQSLLYPEVSVGASVLRVRGSEAVFGAASTLVDLEGSLFHVGFDAVWAVDVFGGTRRTIEAAKAGEQAVGAVRRGVVLTVAGETARAYVELRGMQRELAVARATLQDQRRTLTLTEEKRRNGLSSDLEVVRARTEVESAAAQVPPLEQATRQYIHLISTLLGLAPTALSGELAEPAPIPVAPSQLSVGIPSDLLRRRPDIQAAERQLAAATAQVGAATAELFPKLVLGGSAGLASRHGDDLFNVDSSDNSSTYYALGPSINWTVFDAGRRKSGIQRSEAQVDAAKAAYQETVLRAFREVESSLVAVDRGRARLLDLQRLSVSAREASTIAVGDYERGIVDQLTVLDAQRQANRADMLLAEGQMGLSVQVVTLYKALGGGWEIAEPPPATPPAESASASETGKH